VQSAVIDPATILTQTEPLTSAMEAYATFDRRQAGWLKVKLEPAAQRKAA
jgi:threonine dehydrogenase-like Zn-dependent dehydrogenase